MVIDSVKQILAEFKPAGWHKDLVDAGFVREIINQGQGLTIRLVLPFAGLSLLDQLKENYDARLRSATGAARIDWALEIDVASMPRAQGLNAVQGIRNIIVVASGKGWANLPLRSTWRWPCKRGGAGRYSRCRYLWPFHSHHDGHPHRAPGQP